MLLDFIAMIAAGAGLAGVILLLRKLSGGRLPKWTLPAAIGLGMLSFSVWNEYSWYDRTAGALPASVVVLSAPPTKQALRPWTYLFPVHHRFLAYDGGSTQTSVDNPAIRQGQVAVVERWQATQWVPIAVDCAKGLQAYMAAGASIAPDGTLTGADWTPAEVSDSLQTTACKDS